MTSRVLIGLDPERVLETVDLLERRIEERFPGSGLLRICGALYELAAKARERTASIGRPIQSLRIAVALAIVGMFGVIVVGVATARLPSAGLTLTELVTAFEALINDFVLLGAAIFFLVTLEARIKRRRALAAIQELRAIAHVIDMHQLAKDPERAMVTGHRTASSPKLELTPFQLSRYLDYCSEMLSLTSKLAALYAERLDDGVVLGAVNELEDLTTGLSRKIWQKIMIVRGGVHESVLPHDEAPADAPSRVTPDD